MFDVNQLIPLFVLSEIHPPSPDALCSPGLVDGPPGTGGPRAAPRKLVTTASWWDANQLPCALGDRPS